MLYVPSELMGRCNRKVWRCVGVGVTEVGERADGGVITLLVKRGHALHSDTALITTQGWWTWSRHCSFMFNSRERKRRRQAIWPFWGGCNHNMYIFQPCKSSAFATLIFKIHISEWPIGRTVVEWSPCCFSSKGHWKVITVSSPLSTEQGFISASIQLLPCCRSQGDVQRLSGGSRSQPQGGRQLAASLTRA